MPEVHQLAEGGTYDPDTLDMLSDILADAWIKVGHAFKTPGSVEEARTP